MLRWAMDTGTMKLSRLILLTLLTAGCANPADSGESGLVGTTLLASPCAVIREDQPCPDQPFSAGSIVMSAGQDPVTAFTSDTNGHFEIALSPGDYIVVPDENAPLPYPGGQRHQVTVLAERITEITLLFDSGIR